MLNIAIDGPAGAGKSTIAKAVSSALNCIYVDTGAMYRSIGLYAVENGISPEDKPAVVAALPNIKLELAYDNGAQRILLNGRDVSDKIRENDISVITPAVAAIPEVRSFLVKCQQEIAEKNNVVMDGRDIGTTVLPNANVKIFLTASPEERARRRHAEYLAKGENVSYNNILKDMIKRDEQDSTRAVSPLTQAEDAALVDTTGLSFKKSVEVILDLVKSKMGKYTEK